MIADQKLERALAAKLSRLAGAERALAIRRRAAGFDELDVALAQARTDMQRLAMLTKTAAEADPRYRDTFPAQLTRRLLEVAKLRAAAARTLLQQHADRPQVKLPRGSKASAGTRS